jgi:tetratricopeptide (TPR) repeat protein
MRTLSRSRRFLIAGVSLVIAAATFRGAVSDALVTRGDDRVRFGDRLAAARYYERALDIAPANTTAADRLAFSLAIQHDRPSVRRALAVSTHALARNPANLNLIADRAFAEMRLGKLRDAADDFARAGRLGRDARYASFAARLALASGDRARAQRERVAARADDPSFAPARLQLDPKGRTK